jgi:hypothetical protein
LIIVLCFFDFFFYLFLYQDNHSNCKLLLQLVTVIHVINIGQFWNGAWLNIDSQSWEKLRRPHGDFLRTSAQPQVDGGLILSFPLQRTRYFDKIIEKSWELGGVAPKHPGAMGVDLTGAYKS